MILRAVGLRKLYGEVCALDGVSLAIDAGEFVSIIGPNGAGKSTLINVLTGVLRPTAGAVTFKDRDVSGLGPARLAQNPASPPGATITIAASIAPKISRQNGTTDITQS